MKSYLRALVLGVSVATAGIAAAPFVQPAAADIRAMALPVDKTPLVAVTGQGERTFSIEIADEAMEQQRGLMFREEMPDDRGMLFDLGVTRNTSFWMENTPMPLDLLFIGDDGRVKAILKGKPFSRASISPNVPVRFVLELKDGISAANGIKPGDRLHHPTIDAVAGAN